MINGHVARLVFLLITRIAAWLRLTRREEAWKTAEILLLRRQLAVLQRQQPHRPKLNWADRALMASQGARRHGLRLLVTPDTILRWHCESSAATGPPGPCGAAHVDSVVDDFVATFKFGDPDSVSSYVATSDEGHLWLYTPGSATAPVRLPLPAPLVLLPLRPC
jgi:hypothetical protein